MADVTLVVYLAFLAWSLPQLPELVVSHIGADGPDGWMSKGWFVATFAGTVLSLEALFRWGMPALMRRTPPALMNIPNRGYWMATPARQDEARMRVLALLGPTRLFMNAVLLLALHACVQASGVPVFVELPLNWLGLAIGGSTLLFTGAVFGWAFTTFKVPQGAR